MKNIFFIIFFTFTQLFLSATNSLVIPSIQPLFHFEEIFSKNQLSSQELITAAIEFSEVDSSSPEGTEIFNKYLELEKNRNFPRICKHNRKRTGKQNSYINVRINIKPIHRKSNKTNNNVSAWNIQLRIFQHFVHGTSKSLRLKSRSTKNTFPRILFSLHK